MAQQLYVVRPHVSSRAIGRRGQSVLAPQPEGRGPDGRLAADFGLRVRLPTNTEPVLIWCTGSDGQGHEKRTDSRNEQIIELLHHLGTLS